MIANKVPFLYFHSSSVVACCWWWLHFYSRVILLKNPNTFIIIEVILIYFQQEHRQESLLMIARKTAAFNSIQFVEAMERPISTSADSKLLHAKTTIIVNSSWFIRGVVLVDKPAHNSLYCDIICKILFVWFFCRWIRLRIFYVLR